VDPSDTTREELRNVLLGLEQIWLEAECSRYEFFYDVIAQSQPDVVMISLDSDQNKALHLISTLSAEAPELPILAVSARGDGQAILQALRSGAKEFITAPVVMEELMRAIQRLQRPSSGVVSRQGEVVNTRVESQVIAILGSRGGVGCTTLGVNLGATMAQDSSLSVALVDLDLALGDADVALDLVADYTLADVALNVDRLDMQFLRRSLSRHSSGLSLLPHPVQMEDASLIREDQLQRVIGLLRASYSHLILDLSKSFSPNDVTCLHLADTILLVAQLELSSLRNVVRMLMTLSADEAVAQKVKIVLNRVGRDNDISVAKAEETIGKPIFWQIPDEPKSINEARNDGKPLIEAAPKSKAQGAFQGLTDNLLGRSVRAKSKESSRGWSLFSRK
jgi:pilus assembly protein CpaE